MAHRRLLVVTENRETRDALRRALGDRADMGAARDAQEALSLFEWATFDAVVADGALPGGGAREVLRRMQQEHPSVRRVHLSPPAPAADDERAGIVEATVDRMPTGDKLEEVLSAQAPPSRPHAPCPSRSGPLSETPLLALLVDLAVRVESGTLELRPPGGKRALLVMAQGRAVRADAPGPYLGRVLLELGRITQEQHDLSLWTLARTKQPHGEILLDLGAIDLAGLRDGLREQLACKVRAMFEMPEVTEFAFYSGIEFVPSRPREEEAQLDPMPILWQAARENAPEAHMKQVLAACELMQISPRAALDRLRLNRDERAAIDVLRARPLAVAQFVATGVADPRTLERLAYVLLLAGFVQSHAESRAPDTTSSRTRAAAPRAPSVPPPRVPSARPPPARALSQPPPSRSQPPPPSTSAFAQERGSLDRISFSSPVAIARQGTIANPAEPRALLALPLVRAPRPDEMEPIALAVLLARVLAQTHVTGTLTVEHERRSVLLAIQGGGGLVAKHETLAVSEAFSWPLARFRFDPTPPEPQFGRELHGLRRLSVQGLRLAMRGFGEQPLQDALGDRVAFAPRPRADAEARTRSLGLLDIETRLLRFVFDGSSTVGEILARGGVSRHTVLSLLVLLAAFECVEWVATQRSAAAPQDLLGREVRDRAKHMEDCNFFDALGVHWSADDEEVTDAYRAILRDASEGGPWHHAAPDACAVIAARAEAAFRVLRERSSRTAYRKKAFPDLDVDAAAYVLEQRMRALAMRIGDPVAERQARSARLALEELRGTRRGGGSSGSDL